jgi:DNA (cytosine-5)-methyltransferase 1
MRDLQAKREVRGDDRNRTGASVRSSHEAKSPANGQKPRLLDLFCGAGGCTKGYQRAGFYVVGVDNRPQPHYCGDEFCQADATVYALEGFDVIHASPPCQLFSAYQRANTRQRLHLNLIPPVRARVAASGLPYVIENVEGAPLDNPIRICGTGLALDVQRHRLFESNVPMMGIPCSHGRNAARFDRGSRHIRPNDRRTVAVGEWRIPLDLQQRAMGIDWMTVPELSQAIPPAYTEHIGGYLLAEINARRVAA